MKKKRKTKILSIIIILIIIISAGYFLFFNKKEENKVIENKKQVKEEKTVKVIDLNSDSRNYAVMINNASSVWGYQSGLQDAHIVYEIIVEGGYTRLMAIYKDKNLDRIGSVRSSRHYFLDYALENDAIYVHFGWSPKAQSDISELGVDNINFLTYSKGYERDTSLGLSREHTAFTSTDKIMKAADEFNYKKTSNKSNLLNYSADSVNLSNMDGAITANNIYIGYSANRSTSYEYDVENKVYKRLQNNTLHTDYVTKKQYTAKNIIVYDVKNNTISGDNKNRQDINNIGSGNGYYISNGYAVPIRWTKDTRSSQTKYSYLDGTEITVNDGNTFIQIYPTNQTLTIE